MSEKKRIRPTLGQVRALESEVNELKEQVRLLEKANGYTADEVRGMEEYKRKFEEQLEGTSVLVKDCDAWREKYRSLDEECSVLKTSNDHMEKEQKRLNGKLQKAADRIHELETEIHVLKSRGFWARVFNK